MTSRTSLARMTVKDWLDILAYPSPIGAGGSAAGVAGAQGAALLAMVAGVLVKRKKREGLPAHAQRWDEISHSAVVVAQTLLELAQQDLDVVSEARESEKLLQGPLEMAHIISSSMTWVMQMANEELGVLAPDVLTAFRLMEAASKGLYAIAMSNGTTYQTERVTQSARDTGRVFESARLSLMRWEPDDGRYGEGGSN